ncbi:hypothetical protein BKA65DRAFT_558235 [Rhexocercosporidium sp. MPI-PUGE-AT-0058]|nr:hypothetical protein BKA65DRAFT_558235 [Rhexocercosporidium sp. MPI-PUGE-AT-0058]
MVTFSRWIHLDIWDIYGDTISAHQGAGLLDPHAAIALESLISPQQLNPGTLVGTVKKILTVKNSSKPSKIYILSHEAAGLVNGNKYRIRFISQTYPILAIVSFSTSSITVQAGSSATIDPLYSGYFVVKSYHDPFILPYVGEPWDPVSVNIIAQNPICHDRHQGLRYPVRDPCGYIRFDAVTAKTNFVPGMSGFDANAIYSDRVFLASNVTKIVGLDTVFTIGP